MSKLKSAVRYLTDSDYRWQIHDVRGHYQTMPDEEYLKQKYRIKTGRPLNLDDPRTFNEKMQWLKLHDRKPIYTTMVDKYAVKAWVAERIGEQYVIPCLGVWDRAEEIDFDALPDRFVLKCTHDSHGLILCKDKKTLDREETRRKLSAALRRDYYDKFREWPYKDVQPRILAEAYMDNNGQDLVDYKVHCFGGVPRVILVCADRFAPGGMTEDFLNCDWQPLPVRRPGVPKAKVPPARPEQLPELLKLSEKLSEGIPFVRADFYIAGGRVYFGEMTFFPTSGFKAFDPEEWDLKLGDFIMLPQKEQNRK